MKTYEIKCHASYARTLKIPTVNGNVRNPYAEQSIDMVTIGFETASEVKTKEEILLQFLSRPKNIQFVGKSLTVDELTPNTVEYRKEKYQNDIKDAEALLTVAREFYVQLL